MSYTKLDPATVFQFVVRSLRKSLALAMFAVIAAFSAHAVTQSAGPLTIQQLGDALTIYHKNTINNDGKMYYTLSATSGRLRMEVVLSLSPSGRVIWITSDIAPAAGSGRAMLNLLKKNTEIGPMFFSVNGDRVRLSYPVANFNQTSESVREALRDFLSTAMNTAELWESEPLDER